MIRQCDRAVVEGSAVVVVAGGSLDREVLCDVVFDAPENPGCVHPHPPGVEGVVAECFGIDALEQMADVVIPDGVLLRVVDLVVLEVGTDQPFERSAVPREPQLLKERRDPAGVVDDLVDMEGRAVGILSVSDARVGVRRESGESDVRAERVLVPQCGLKMGRVVGIGKRRAGVQPHGCPVGGPRLRHSGKREQPRNGERRNGRYRSEKLAGQRIRTVVAEPQRQARNKLLVRMPLQCAASLQCPDPAESIARAGDAFLPGIATFSLYREPRTELIADRAADEAAESHAVEPSVSRVDAELQRIRGFRGDVVHGAAGRVLAEERALRTFQHLHSFDIEAGERRHGGVGQWRFIDIHGHRRRRAEIAIEEPHASQRKRDGIEGAFLHRETRHQLRELRNRRDAPAAQRIPRNRGDGHADGVGGLLHLLCRDDDFGDLAGRGGRYK